MAWQYQLGLVYSPPARIAVFACKSLGQTRSKDIHTFLVILARLERRAEVEGTGVFFVNL